MLLVGFLLRRVRANAAFAANLLGEAAVLASAALGSMGCLSYDGFGSPGCAIGAAPPIMRA